jgi:serine/threonine-protein phosphatase 2A regulatory subunit B'
MVYNAMKLFMEINPQLFDDCSHEYTEHQNSTEARNAAREAKWKALAEQAKHVSTNGTSAKPPAVDGVDESAKRLEQLDLKDGQTRRPSVHERQNSVGSARSQQ